MKLQSPRIAAPLLLHASTTHPLRQVLSRLKHRVEIAGAFLRERRPPTPRDASLTLELYRDSSEDLYVGLVASGLDLSRPAHIALASLCTPDPSPPRPGASTHIEIQLEIRCLDTHRNRFVPTLAVSA